MTFNLCFFLRVTAEQKREFTPSGLTTPYKYTREIVNTMPINVELQTTSTVDVVFKMIVSTKERNDFVLFVGGEESLETGKHIVTILMIVTFFFLNTFFFEYQKKNTIFVKVKNRDNFENVSGERVLATICLTIFCCKYYPDS